MDDQGLEVWQGQDIVLFSETSRLTLGPTQPRVQWVPEFFPRGEATQALWWPLFSIQCRGYELLEP
jgi:hypothetical protein